MTNLEIYMIMAPLALLGIGAAVTYWWTHHTTHH